MTAIATSNDTVVSLVRPSAAQAKLLADLGYAGPLPATRSDTTRLITQLQTVNANKEATPNQIGKLLSLGGRTMPGAKQRETSTQISFLELLLAWETADTDEQHQAVIDRTFDLIRERFTKAKSADEYIAAVNQQFAYRQMREAAATAPEAQF